MSDLFENARVLPGVGRVGIMRIVYICQLQKVLATALMCVHIASALTNLHSAGSQHMLVRRGGGEDYAAGRHNGRLFPRSLSLKDNPEPLLLSSNQHICDNGDDLVIMHSMLLTKQLMQSVDCITQMLFCNGNLCQIALADTGWLS